MNYASVMETKIHGIRRSFLNIAKDNPVLFWGALAVLLLSLLSHILYAYQPFFMDELPIIRNQIRFLHERTIIPDHAKYPTFYYYVSLPATVVTVVLKFLFGEYRSVVQAVSEMYLFDKRALATGARFLNIAMLYVSAALIADVIRRQTSLLAAALAFLFLVSAPGLLEYSSYALPDVSLILLTAGALCFLYKVQSPGDFLYFFIAVAFMGLAISTKYNAAGILASAAVWGVAVHKRAGQALSARVLARVSISIVVLVFFFLLGSPGWIIDPAFFFDELSFEIKHASTGHLGYGGVPLLGQFELLLTHLPFLFLIAIPGAILAVRRSRGESMIPISAVVGTLALAAVSKKQSFHYMFPAIPGLVILAGFTLHEIVTQLGNAGTRALGLFVLVICLMSAHQSFMYLKPSTTEDTKAWFVDNVPEGTKVALDWAYVPNIHSADSIKRIRNGQMYKQLGSDPVAAEPKYDVISYDYDFRALNDSDTQYFVSSAAVFDRFFEFGVFTRTEPTEGAPLFGKFQRRRQFYVDLFGSPSWKIVFETNTGNGPRTIVFKRVRSERE